jgi:hypothetical protein
MRSSFGSVVRICYPQTSQGLGEAQVTIHGEWTGHQGEAPDVQLYHN